MEGFCDLVSADCQYTGVTGYNPARNMDVDPRFLYGLMFSCDSSLQALL